MTFPFGTWNLFSGAMPCYFQGLGIIPPWNPLQTWRPAYLSSDQFFGLNVPQPGKRPTANGDSKRWWFPTTGEKRLFHDFFRIYLHFPQKNQLKVGKYTIHGWYAVGQGVFFSGCVWRGTLGFNNHSNSGRYRDTVEISQQKWKDMRPCCWNHNVPFHSAPIENIDEKRLLMRRSTEVNYIPKKATFTRNLPHKHHFKRVKQTSNQSSPETQMITVLSLPVPLLTIKP